MNVKERGWRDGKGAGAAIEGDRMMMDDARGTGLTLRPVAGWLAFSLPATGNTNCWPWMLVALRPSQTSQFLAV